jgi:hypothetical protein
LVDVTKEYGFTLRFTGVLKMEFSKEELEEIYNSLINLRDFVISSATKELQEMRYINARNMIERLEFITKLIDKVDKMIK